MKTKLLQAPAASEYLAERHDIHIKPKNVMRTLARRGLSWLEFNARVTTKAHLDQYAQYRAAQHEAKRPRRSSNSRTIRTEFAPETIERNRRQLAVHIADMRARDVEPLVVPPGVTTLEGLR